MTAQSKIVSAGRKPVRVQSGLSARRVASALAEVAEMGLTAGTKNKRVSGRTHARLFEAAASVSGLDGSDLIEYALAKVATEDDWVEKFLALEGTVSRDVDLEF